MGTLSVTYSPKTVNLNMPLVPLLLLAQGTGTNTARRQSGLPHVILSIVSHNFQRFIGQL